MNPKPLTKLLVVDDDSDTLLITRYSLQSLKNVEVKYVSSGKEALREALQFQPDLILLDVMMPEMDGITTLKTMQKTDTLAHIPVVFFSAKVQQEEVTSYLHAGAVDVIVKPFDPLTLGETILKIWGKLS